MKKGLRVNSFLCTKKAPIAGSLICMLYTSSNFHGGHGWTYPKGHKLLVLTLSIKKSVSIVCNCLSAIHGGHGWTRTIDLILIRDAL